MMDDAWPTGLLFGTVAGYQVGPKKLPRVRVRLAAYGNMRTWLLPVLHPKTKVDQVFWLPSIGEHVAVLLDEFGEDGVVLGAIYSEADLAPTDSADVMVIAFGDGTRLEYNRATHHLLADVKGSVLLRASGHVAITAATIGLTGQVTVNGTLQVTDDVTLDADLKAGRTTINGDLAVDGAISASGKVSTSGMMFAKNFVKT